MWHTIPANNNGPTPITFQWIEVSADVESSGIVEPLSGKTSCMKTIFRKPTAFPENPLENGLIF